MRRFFLCLAAASLLSGCATVAKTVEAGKATLDIIGGASTDIESVWNASGKKVTDATGMTTETPAK